MGGVGEYIENVHGNYYAMLIIYMVPPNYKVAKYSPLAS
jgi:hypothetical protein